MQQTLSNIMKNVYLKTSLYKDLVPKSGIQGKNK